jgi:hypothetical protein
VGLIVGVVVGVTAGIALAALLVVFLIKKRNNFVSHHHLDSDSEKKYTRSNSIELVGNMFKPITNIEIGERLGGGAFADVYRGIWNVKLFFLMFLKKVEKYTSCVESA